MLPAELTNQFTTGGMILVLMGGVMAYMRAVPEYIWHWVKGQVTVSINVKDDDLAFEWTKEWLARQDFTKRMRRVDLDSSIRGATLTLMPAPGQHTFWRKGRPFWLHFIRSDEAKGDWQSKRAETLRFTTLGRNRAILERFVEEILKSKQESERSESDLYVYNDHWWERYKAYSPRKIEAVILPGQEKNRLLDDIRKFLNSKEKYASLGIPYHRGYVFYGPPGTGKTSLASSLGNEFGMSVYVMNLGSFSDGSLKTAMGRIPPNSIVMFEDIDAATSTQKRVDKSKKPGENSNTMESVLGVTLSGILNVLDGFYAPDGVIYIMTTNHIDNLDPALLRPGRIDYRLLLGEATEGQKIEMYRRFFPESTHEEAETFVRNRPTTETMAEFQGLLLTKRKE